MSSIKIIIINHREALLFRRSKAALRKCYQGEARGHPTKIVVTLATMGVAVADLATITIQIIIAAMVASISSSRPATTPPQGNTARVHSSSILTEVQVVMVLVGTTIKGAARKVMATRKSIRMRTSNNNTNLMKILTIIAAVEATTRGVMDATGRSPLQTATAPLTINSLIIITNTETVLPIRNNRATQTTNIPPTTTTTRERNERTLDNEMCVLQQSL